VGFLKPGPSISNRVICPPIPSRLAGPRFVTGPWPFLYLTGQYPENYAGLTLALRTRVLTCRHVGPRSLLMTIFKLDQADEEMLAQQISDEALELAGSKTAANYTIYFCTALDLCPGP
jgi:hypothetical protein